MAPIGQIELLKECLSEARENQGKAAAEMESDRSRNTMETMAVLNKL
jgi:hypothetical protein